jgi:hypothetical protein
MKRTVLSKKSKIKVFISIIILIILNTFVIILNQRPLESTHIIDNAGKRSGEISDAILLFTPIILGIPLLGITLGSIASFIPYKGLSYRNKIYPFFLLGILFLYAWVLIRGLVRFLLEI